MMPVSPSGISKYKGRLKLIGTLYITPMRKEHARTYNSSWSKPFMNNLKSSGVFERIVDNRLLMLKSTGKNGRLAALISLLVSISGNIAESNELISAL